MALTSALVRLSAAERTTFNDFGYIAIKRVLSPDHVERLLAAGRQLRQSGVSAEDHDINWWHRYDKPLADASTGTVWERFRIVERHPVFLELIDLPETLHRIVDILNCNIYMSCSHLKFRAATRDQAVNHAQENSSWHRDLGTSMYEMQEPHPRLSVVAAFWLTDLSQPGAGNLRVVPGSHRLRGAPCRNPETMEPYGTTEILAEPGDVLLFDQRLWHAGSTNRGTHERACLFYRYVYRWIRPSDYVTVPDEFLRGLSSVRQQLLGRVWTDLGYINPSPEKDLPLLTWWNDQVARSG